MYTLKMKRLWDVQHVIVVKFRMRLLKKQQWNTIFASCRSRSFSCWRNDSITHSRASLCWIGLFRWRNDFSKGALSKTNYQNIQVCVLGMWSQMGKIRDSILKWCDPKSMYNNFWGHINLYYNSPRVVEDYCSVARYRSSTTLQSITRQRFSMASLRMLR